ncbi:spermidine synthase [Pelolinea submarina]|uniref:Putative membrane-bound spermidine synthase n=1 Tax=Pelolinea submarina TaxID=913107 RepID=A0A3E0AG32_9CHLR|nr:fused MFS/spermidine synthase [Pelolinea submarina]REG10611.1 putative membrane-bound spermidine synthase [Pelolinea submarina]
MRRYLYLGVFFAGCASLAVEMSASRLLGNYYGSSNLVWAIIIGLILIYLSVGYTIGGKWADRSPEFSTFFTILAWASLLIGLVPLAARPILRTASQAFDNMQVGVMVGAFISVLALFSLPVTLLGTASPFAVRLALQEKEHSGVVVGKIYTLSTLGSFLGTFLPVLLLIPAIGTYRTFVAISAGLMLVTFFCLAMTAGFKPVLKLAWMPLVLALATFIGLRGFDKQAEGIIYEGESAYNYIQVQEINDYRMLRLNEGQGIHSIYHPTRDNFNGSWEQVLVAPYFNTAPISPEEVSEIALLGLAAGTSAREAYQVYPQATIDGFEIDPEIVSVGYDLFHMDVPSLNVYIEDARWGLSHTDARYDIISIDAYKPPYIPWHLTTQEFFQQTYDHLSDNGALVINVARILDNRRLVDSLYTTIHAVYPSVYVVDIPDTLNSMIFATRQPTQADNLIDNYIALSENPDTPNLLLSTLETAVLNIQPDPPDGTLFTDDKASVEWITNAMILDVFRSNQIEAFQ